MVKFVITKWNTKLNWMSIESILNQKFLNTLKSLNKRKQNHFNLTAFFLVSNQFNNFTTS